MKLMSVEGLFEIIETVKNQPRNILFDFEFNTVKGKKI